MIKNKEKYHVAIAGATGAVGRKMLEILEERDFPIGKLKLLASSRSVGKVLEFKGKEIVIEELRESSFVDMDIALFSAGAGTSLQFAPSVEFKN